MATRDALQITRVRFFCADLAAARAGRVAIWQRRVIVDWLAGHLDHAIKKSGGRSASLIRAVRLHEWSRAKGGAKTKKNIAHPSWYSASTEEMSARITALNTILDNAVTLLNDVADLLIKNKHTIPDKYMGPEIAVYLLNLLVVESFRRQQGGDESNNDDYFVMGVKNFYKLIDLPFTKEISLW